jgi:ParB-like chromosome segregation protein Spo0J
MTQTTNKYQVMPPLSDEEYQALKEDIAENGVQVPVVRMPRGISSTDIIVSGRTRS